MILNESSLLNKIPTFLVENKKLSQNFVIAFEKMCFGLDPDPDWEKMPGSGSVKNKSGFATLQKSMGVGSGRGQSTKNILAYLIYLKNLSSRSTI